MKTYSMMKFTTAFAALACWAGLALAGPLGELEIQGDVRLTQMGSSESMTLSNTSYSWFAGDRVVTGNSPASLRMGSGNSLAIGPNSELMLTRDAGYLQAELARGSLAFLFSSNGTPLRVNGSEALPTGRLGMIEVGESGALRTYQGSDAEVMAEEVGLSVTESGLSATCKDARHCENSRPRSISP